MPATNATIMFKDIPVVRIENGLTTVLNEILCPLYFKHFSAPACWLANRAADNTRPNVRAVKKAIGIEDYNDIETALFVNAATITDCFWIKRDNEDYKWNDVQFKFNDYADIALNGIKNENEKGKGPRTPELTNTGSFEKCWCLEDGKWWMYKTGDENEIFSELFVCELGKQLNFPMAHYEYADGYIKTLDFTDNASVNLEPIASVVGDDEDYDKSFNYFYSLSPKFAEEFLKIIYLDTVCQNPDRHTFNYGVLRDINSGEILSLAPNYDNNMALLARNQALNSDRSKDGLMNYFFDFLQKNQTAVKMLKDMDIPTITNEMLSVCFNNIPLKVNEPAVSKFVINGQKRVEELLDEVSLVSPENYETGNIINEEER